MGVASGAIGTSIDHHLPPHIVFLSVPSFTKISLECSCRMTVAISVSPIKVYLSTVLRKKHSTRNAPLSVPICRYEHYGLDHSAHMPRFVVVAIKSSI